MSTKYRTELAKGIDLWEKYVEPLGTNAYQVARDAKPQNQKLGSVPFTVEEGVRFAQGIPKEDRDRVFRMTCNSLVVRLNRFALNQLDAKDVAHRKMLAEKAPQDFAKPQPFSKVTRQEHLAALTQIHAELKRSAGAPAEAVQAHAWRGPQFWRGLD